MLTALAAWREMLALVSFFNTAIASLTLLLMVEGVASERAIL
jgi:hypothetical protein